jgi:hypothetical protein
MGNQIIIRKRLIPHSEQERNDPGPGRLPPLKSSSSANGLVTCNHVAKRFWVTVPNRDSLFNILLGAATAFFDSDKPVFG